MADYHDPGIASVSHTHRANTFHYFIPHDIALLCDLIVHQLACYNECNCNIACERVAARAGGVAPYVNTKRHNHPAMRRFEWRWWISRRVEDGDARTSSTPKRTATPQQSIALRSHSVASCRFKLNRCGSQHDLPLHTHRTSDQQREYVAANCDSVMLDQTVLASIVRSLSNNRIDNSICI